MEEVACFCNELNDGFGLYDPSLEIHQQNDQRYIIERKNGIKLSGHVSSLFGRM